MVPGRAIKQQRLLVVDDYGAGGVWTRVLAASAADIERDFPELKVVAEPGWMTTEEQARIAEEATYDLMGIDHLA